MGLHDHRTPRRRPIHRVRVSLDDGIGEELEHSYDRRVQWPMEGRLPTFMLTPEDLRAKLAVLFGGQDVDFDDSPEFSRRYRLRGTDEDAVRALDRKSTRLNSSHGY